MRAPASGTGFPVITPNVMLAGYSPQSFIDEIIQHDIANNITPFTGTAAQMIQAFFTTLYP